MSSQCVCCNVRMEPNNRRSFHGIVMRLFVPARRSMSLPGSGSICNACRMCYRKWRSNSEVAHILDCIKDESNETVIASGNQVRS